jgi:hypothetical protein
MILKKITTGFVIQEFDTETKQFVSQEFVAGDECDYEDENGDAVDCQEFADDNGQEQYLPYDMVQPNE